MKHLKSISLILLSLLMGLTFFSCKKDPLVSKVTVSCTMPDGYSDAMLSSIVLKTKNVSTGKTTSNSFATAADNKYELTLNEGLYDFTLEAKIQVELDGVMRAVSVRGYTESVKVTGETCSASIKLFIVETSEGFVIAEIFFTGTQTPEGKQYVGDTYFRIYNNSDEVQYADGLVIAESDFLTVSKYNYSPDIMSQAMAVSAVYRVPGNGTDYPVQPGKSILICDNAIDHRSANSNSFDLSSADFEWYDESTNPNFADIDNPAVTNLDKIYCYTATIWVPHNRGFKSYALARFKESKETFLRDYVYNYSYDLVTAAGTFPMTGDCYKIPNEWILDAVNLSVESEFEWIVTDPSLDMGWTYCGKIDRDQNRYGKSVRRKVDYTTAEGIVKLKDTNNSSEDFAAEQTADPFWFN
ncbi:DUF4876 domain-containing protein [Bacteroidales bacterium OttesenSCG-928-B11]|nr:DUF4876 domain-containing protein [Bacteroidales bacterium OttesenSCG-928-E04]MDL2312369.1 DUF4876 domain-containing protein [Bacteroidales bacterium OttesenSCG-928-B11]MDL2326924.1 DUF4876 domain-containing protein [Bacteroidales bacterium OttesenSCG-928-A14]